ncbi:unnamed protein product [Echinostoma caproni]|uniref:Protein kinase domain-containing protein n=1 Tax=Echinostoma caproni TaxID=27848 RepID=A0A183AMV3_9TREM|nr:unnamed protein product [Echinostoma caproni]
MCRLTLLDRLLLGLNCSVSQNDDEIHVKRLHKDELSILTQRIDKTGFSVHSLSVRRNANNDAEYNIVLTFSPNADTNVRRVRCGSLTTRTRLLGSGHSSDGSRESATYSGTKSKLKSRQLAIRSLERRGSSRKRFLQNNVDHSHRRAGSVHSIGSGYHSDTDVFCKKLHHTKLRRAYSDTDLVGLQQNANESGISIGQRPVESLSNQINIPTLNSEVNTERHSPVIASGPLPPNKEWLRSSTLDRVPSCASERHYPSDPVAQKRVLGMPRAVLERQSYDEVHPMTATSTAHGISKRALGLDTHNSNHMAPFRRHSPRKVIRKVYTASANTSSALNSLTTASSTTNVSSSTASTILFEEATSNLSVCPPTSVAGFSFQYRRFPTPVMPVAVVPPSTKLVDHSVSVTPTAPTSASLFNDSRLSGVFRFRPVSSIPMGPVATKTPERTHLTELSAVSSMDVKRSNTNPPFSVMDDVNVPTVDEKMDSPKVTDEQTPKSPMNVVSSEQTTADLSGLKSTEEIVSTSKAINPSAHEPACSVSPDVNPELANSENELPPDWDGSYTPATSMSASQLLKLKRLHDEAGRVVAAPNESRTPQSGLYSPRPGRVQSPQALPLQGKQTQSIHTETGDTTRLAKPSQFESSAYEFTPPPPQQQQPKQKQQQQTSYQQQPFSSQQSQQQQPQRTTLTNRHQFGSDICSAVPPIVVHEPAAMDVTVDADEFELKSVDQSVGLTDAEQIPADPNVSFHPGTVAPIAQTIASAPSNSVLRPSVDSLGPLFVHPHYPSQ